MARMILAGLSGIIIVEIYAAVMQREFQNTDNRIGKGFAVLGIYLFVVVYCASLLIGSGTRILGCNIPTSAGQADILSRWHAEQHYVAVWSRSSTHCLAKQGHGTCCRISLYRQCGK